MNILSSIHKWAFYLIIFFRQGHVVHRPRCIFHCPSMRHFGLTDRLITKLNDVLISASVLADRYFFCRSFILCTYIYIYECLKMLPYILAIKMKFYLYYLHARHTLFSITLNIFTCLTQLS